MDDYTTLIQDLLTKKEKECGELSQLSSRVTQENNIYINGICDDIAAILKSVGLEYKRQNMDQNLRCISVYKYLALNTNFKCLKLLAQDNANTHLIDICPLLSPYLFIEIIWRLHYEDILAESILHLPLDFANEIIGIARSCIDMLHFDRASRFMNNLILKCCKKIILIKNNGTQTTDISENMSSLVYNIQELLDIFLTENFLKLELLPDNEKFTRQGIVLKNILDIVIMYVNYQRETVETSPLLDKYYKVTFGLEPIKKCAANELEQHFDMLLKHMMILLTKKIKEVSCKCYIEWVESDDIECPTITLQKAIGLRCYNLADIIKKDEKLIENEHLLECLQQMLSKPDPETEAKTLSLDDLISQISDEKMECTVELFRRYKNWDEKTFDKIKNLKFSANEEICLLLLDYIVFLRSDPTKKSFSDEIYLYAMSHILHLEPVLFVKVIIAFILKYNGSNILELPNTETSFKNFIEKNPDFGVEHHYRVGMLFMLKNVKKYMRLFTEAFLGMSEYTRLPMQDLIYFVPFMTIKDNDNNYLILSSIKDILLENKDFIQQLETMFEKLFLFTRPIKKHDIINMVVTPYLLADCYPQKCLENILIYLPSLWENICISKVDLKNFYQGITKKLSYARKDRSDFRANNCRIITHLYNFFKTQLRELNLEQKDAVAILTLIEPFLEPLDRWYFMNTCLSWPLIPTNDYIIRDYERRFFCTKYKISHNSRIPKDLRLQINDVGLLMEDFLRHSIIHSNNKEYISQGMSIIKGLWSFLNWNNPVDSFTNFSRITMEACQLCLEYPEDFAVCTFFTLLGFFANFVEEFQSVHIMMLTEKYCSTFVKSIASLDNNIEGTPYVEAYRPMVIRLHNILATEGLSHYSMLSSLHQIVKQFSVSCVRMYNIDNHRYKYNKNHSAIVTRFRLAYNIVNASMAVTHSNVTDCLLKAQLCLSSL